MVESLRGAETGEQEGCKHHWRIASPSGETSKGVCQICGASRDFLNYAYRAAPNRLRKPAAQDAAQR